MTRRFTLPFLHAQEPRDFDIYIMMNNGPQKTQRTRIKQKHK